LHNKTNGVDWPLKKFFVYLPSIGITRLHYYLESFHKVEYIRVCKEHGWVMMLTKERAAQAALEASNTTPDIEPCPEYNQENFLMALI